MARNATPFVPFRIVFTDGRKVDVLHPDYLLISKHFVNIGVNPDPQTGIPAEGVLGSTLHVVRIETLQPAT